MKHNLHVVVFALAFVLLLGCDGRAEDSRVAIAMSSLQEEMNQTFLPPGSQSEHELVRAWSGIPVSDLPADFQMAWSTARTAYAATVEELTQENARVYQNAIENLQIVASQYVPELREQRQIMEEMNRLLGDDST